MGEKVINLGFWADANPGSPPSAKLVLRHHHGDDGVDINRNVDSDRAAIKAAAVANNRTGFNTTMGGYTWWTTYTTAEQDTAWASARYLWS